MRKLATFVLLLLPMLLGACHGTGLDERALKAGEVAPDFTLSDLEGHPVALSDFQGHPIVLNFWATGCPPCREEMPALQAIYERYRDDGLVVLAVNVLIFERGKGAVLAFVREYELTFPVLLDGEGDVMNLYGVRALPTTFFIDREGLIRERVVGGPMPEDFLEERLEPLFRGGA